MSLLRRLPRLARSLGCIALLALVLPAARAQSIQGGATTTVSTGQSLTYLDYLFVGNTTAGTLALNGGGTVTSGNAFIGNSTGAGTVTIDGAGSLWNSSAQIAPGNSGVGSLTLTNGGKVTSAAGAIGNNTGGVGTVIVDGAGSSWTVTNDLTFGILGGVGSLTISNGGNITSGQSIVNAGTGLTSSVSITGAGSLWTNTSLSVGSATFAIASGGKVVSSASGGVNGGNVTVSGADSSWTTLGSFGVGSSKASSLALTAGGTLSSGSGTLGTLANGVGTVTIDGAASSWTNTGALVIGRIAKGTVTVTNGGTLAASTITLALLSSASGGGTINIGTGGTAGVVQATSITNGAGNPGTINFNHTDSAYTFAPQLNGAIKVNQLGSGTTILTGNNTYTGATTVTGGAIAFSSAANLGSGTITLDGGGLKWLAGNSADVSGRLAALGAGGATLSIQDTVTFANGISGSGGLTKSGVGTLTLSAASTYAGGTTLTAGTLAIGSDTALGSGALVINGGSLQAYGSHALANPLTLGATLGVSGADNLALTGGISETGGARALVKTGAGTLTLATANTYTGGTTLSDGALVIGAVGALGSGTVTLADGDVALYLDSTNSALWRDTTNPIMVAAGTGTATIGSTAGNQLTVYNSALTLNRPTTLYDGGNPGLRTNFEGVISGDAGTLTIGGGRVVLAANNTFTGNVVIGDGTTLQLNAAAALPATASVSTGASGVLQLASDSAIGDLSGGSGSVLQVAPGGVPASTLTVGGKNTDSLFAGTIRDTSPGGGSGAFSLIKTGSGTLTLSGASSYTGATMVSGGKLVVNGSLANTGALSVADGATLGGSGTIGGLATFHGGSHLAPGNSPGTLTFTQGLTLEDGAILDFQLGTVSDRIDVTGGDLTGPFTGTITIDVSDAGGFAPGTYDLIHYVTLADGSLDIGILALNTELTGFAYYFTLTGSALQLTVTATAVPEPATCAMLAGLAGLALAALRRRRIA